MKKYVKIFFSRFTIVAFTIVATFSLYFLLLMYGFYVLEETLNSYFPGAAKFIEYTVTALRWIAVVITVLHIVNRDMLTETKIPWLLCVCALNVYGIAIYLVFSHNRPSRRQRRLYADLSEKSARFSVSDVSEREFNEAAGHWSDLSRALHRVCPDSVVFSGTKTEYFPSGEQFLERLLTDLEGAEQYIFMEYFILKSGEMWSRVLEVLKRKAKAGVEVRVIYDDIGCMGKLNMFYAKSLRKEGIKCIKFNPFVPVVSNVHNNRDHRKITVIDGKIGYTGGINISDEYINVVQPFGKWKDTAVRLEGEGVKGLITMFLMLYQLSTKSTEDFAPYIPEEYEKFEDEGYVQPYGAGPRPMYTRQVGEDVYEAILNEAKDYVWIATPYLIIDYRMREALLLAAARGVDVRIITPGIPDKKVAFALTRSNYSALIKGGVKIYEYTPGFVHAKSFLADDAVGVVGTINLDYRSLLHHYEDAVLMYKTKALADIKRDMEETFALSRLLTEEDAKKNVVWRGICEIAKVFAPLF